ncbi:hypothetical protein F5141DRAFT_285735 [Pisolithus sp. B1]|nr:hypothetical protein F5141DRAFT_285735 [Pisolithus sp. B1]
MSTVSGSIGCDSEYLVVEGGIQAQTRAALENISKVLEASGSSMQHAIKVTIYLVHMARDFLPYERDIRAITRAYMCRCICSPDGRIHRDRLHRRNPRHQVTLIAFIIIVSLVRIVVNAG